VDCWDLGITESGTWCICEMSSFWTLIKHCGLREEMCWVAMGWVSNRKIRIQTQSTVWLIWFGFRKFRVEKMGDSSLWAPVRWLPPGRFQTACRDGPPPPGLHSPACGPNLEKAVVKNSYGKYFFQNANSFLPKCMPHF
jgi:hypothetical protein